MALITNEQSQIDDWERLDPEEAAAARAAEIPKWNALFGELQEGGHWAGGAELDVPKTARTVRVRDGETVVTDGPFAETKEQIGGFFVLECEDLDKAIELAAKIPTARRGSIELRPLVE
jgi:hypothetical protein